MANKQAPTILSNKQINQALVEWDAEQKASVYLKKKLGDIDKETGKKKIDVIVDNAIDRAKIEESPEWTKLLLDCVEPNRGSTNQVNVQVNNHEAFVLKRPDKKE